MALSHSKRFGSYCTHGGAVLMQLPYVIPFYCVATCWETCCFAKPTEKQNDNGNVELCTTHIHTQVYYIYTHSNASACFSEHALIQINLTHTLTHAQTEVKQLTPPLLHYIHMILPILRCTLLRKRNRISCYCLQRCRVTLIVSHTSLNRRMQAPLSKWFS